MALAEHVLNRIGGACRDGGGTAIAVLSVLGALLMLQGGYAPPVSSAGALALCVTGLILLAGVRRGPRLSMSPACVVALLVPLALLLAAFAHGISYERLEPMGRWALFVAAVVLSASIMPQLGRRLLSALSWGGVATSVLGLIMVDSSFEFLGWSNAGRLQFFFQYANAAGIWFSSVAVLCWFSSSPVLREFVFVPVSCLLLTQSGGSLALFAPALVAMAVMGLRFRGPDAVLSLVLQCCGSAAVFFACRLHVLLGLVVAIALGVAFRGLDGRRAARTAGSSGRRPLVAAALLLLVVLGGGVLYTLFASGRLAEAAQTLVERLIQVRDGLTLLSQNPLFGIGPGEWRYAYRAIQSAQYTANAIHCSYLQLALDAGLVPVLTLAGLALLSLRGIGTATILTRDMRGDDAEAERRWHAYGPLVATPLLLVHALIDIDFQFGFILAVLGLMLGEGLRRASTPRVSVGPTPIICLGCAALIAAGSLCASAARSSILLALRGAEESQDVARLMSGPLVSLDEGCRTEALAAWYGLGDPRAALDFAERQGLPDDGTQTLLLAQCCYLLDDGEAAEGVLLEALEDEPYFVELFEMTSSLFAAHGASTNAVVRYNEIVEEANSLRGQGAASWLHNQEEISLYP